MADDLLRGGDPERALRNMMKRGFRLPDGRRFEGMQRLHRQMREYRQDVFSRFDPNGIVDQIREQLDRILGLERGEIGRTPGPGPGGGGAAHARAACDERLSDAVDVIRGAQRKDGTWPLHRGYAGRTWFPMEPAGPSRWAILRARRVLQWWDQENARPRQAHLAGQDQFRQEANGAPTRFL